jgi:hypothetical protein
LCTVCRKHSINIGCVALLAGLETCTKPDIIVTVIYQVDSTTLLLQMQLHKDSLRESLQNEGLTVSGLNPNWNATSTYWSVL